MMSISGPPYRIPTDVQLVESECKCIGCSKHFVCRTSPDNALVKFVDAATSQERWLPTFEKGGYLDIVEQCVDGFRRDCEITMKVFREFESKFRSFQHRPATGGYWSVANGCRCPNCGGKKVETLAEQTVNNPKMEWLNYDPIK